MLDFEIVGQGATTKIYRDGNTAIKLYENAPSGEVENEAKRQQFAANAGLPVPAVLGIRKLGAHATALDMEYIAGNPIIQPEMDKDERANAIRVLVKLQCMVHKIAANGQPKQVDRIMYKINQTKYLNESDKLRLLTLLKQLDTGDEKLCHGDLHPLNILYDGSKYWIIDWVDATAGNPLADACRTYLIFKQHMIRSAGIYLRLFCKEANANQDDVLVWLPIVAAARLDENMDDKSRAWLLDIACI